MVVTHASTDDSLAALLRHELRWAATVRQLNPRGYTGMVVTHPLPFALLTLPLAPTLGFWLTIGTLIARLLMIENVQRLCRTDPPSLWLLPLRDLLSFFVFIGGFATGSVDWRGERLRMETQGRISAAGETR
jgi:ceramide glucosyltransferase